ncbi:FkbM family methyltransferase [Nonlabens sp.]|uniref:FkbM family methyltransferase n=1 Tax=Nonlabens sp. TaxID=1888209 RepID=UPI003F69A554
MNFKNLRYRLAKKIIFKLSEFIIRKDLSKTEIKNQSKINFLDGKSYLLHPLNKNIKIKLYADSILSKLILDGFEQKELDFLKVNLSTGDTFIDIGSNIGLFSLVASEVVGNTGKVIAFEPNPKTYSRLLENIKLNDIKNIITYNLGLSDSEKELDFHISNNGYDAWNSFAAEPSKLQENIRVKVQTLDSQIRHLDAKKIKLLKIDVEGWEKFVLNGGSNFLENNNPILIIEFGEDNTLNANYHVQEIFKIMEDLGYAWFDIQDDLSLKQHRKKLNYPYSNLIAKKPTF